MPEENKKEADYANLEKPVDTMYDFGFKKGFIRGVSGALFCIMYHETCSAEDAMDILQIKEEQRDWYRPFLKEQAGENWGVAVALENMEKAKKGILVSAGNNIKAFMPVLLKAISEDTPLEEAGLNDFFDLIVKLRKSGSLGAGVELEQYYKFLSAVKTATEVLASSGRLFDEIEKKYCLKIENHI